MKVFVRHQRGIFLKICVIHGYYYSPTVCIPFLHYEPYKGRETWRQSGHWKTVKQKVARNIIATKQMHLKNSDHFIEPCRIKLQIFCLRGEGSAREMAVTCYLFLSEGSFFNHDKIRIKFPHLSHF